MGADVAIVEGVGQCVLGHDIEISTVEVRITLRFLEAFTKDHVGWHKATRVSPTENKAILWQVGEHVVTVHPSEPVTMLGAFGIADHQGIERNCG